MEMVHNEHFIWMGNLSECLIIVCVATSGFFAM